MRVRSLGTDGPTVPAVGLGDVSLARAAARGVEAGDLARAAHEALEAGVGFVDVAPEADSEKLVGDAVRATRMRDRAIVACRVPGPVLPPAPERPGRVRRTELPGPILAACVESSLRASRLEVLALVWLPLAAPASPELRGACDKLVREGKVLRWGAYVETVEEDTAAILAGGWLAAVNAPLSLCERAAEALIAAEGPAGPRAPGVAAPPVVCARRPLAGGVLAGALGPGVKLAREDDRRAIDLDRAALAAATLAAYAKRLPPAATSTERARQQVAENARPPHLECTTVAELALRWVLDRGALALPRLHHRDHIAEALAAAAAPPLALELPILDI